MSPSKPSNAPDPRVYFAAERTLLAWQRSAIAMIALGFVLERFGLFIKLIAHDTPLAAVQSHLSWGLGLLFMLAGAVIAVLSAIQFVTFCRRAPAAEKPEAYLIWLAPIVNVLLGGTAISLCVWLWLNG